MSSSDMNASFLCAVGLTISSVLAMAFDMPRGIHNMAELDEARAEASERPEPVAFVITKKSLKET